MGFLEILAKYTVFSAAWMNFFRRRRPLRDPLTRQELTVEQAIGPEPPPPNSSANWTHPSLAGILEQAAKEPALLLASELLASRVIARWRLCA
jgi:hypothetical protein